MKTKFILIVLLFLVSLKAFPTIELNCYDPYRGLERTFKPKTMQSPSEHINFKAALFSITKSSVGVMSNAPFYSLYFDGNIDITSGGNKYWNLAGNAEIIYEIDNHIGLGSQTISGFKDCNYNKSVFLTDLL